MSNDSIQEPYIGRYRIVEKIGEGGMGKVYLAHDPKLERDVAIKLLPAELACDKGRLGRFVQEAKAASSLNHPHIITIYEIEDSGSTPYIASEYIDGETLRDRLKGSPMRLADALEVVIQVASALSAAHSAGIVHRDIKPENIMIRRDGYVKVLDFGLAKLSQVPSGADSEAATRNLVRTDPGSIMGTVAYMSPEQARGLEVDARSDLWSLGAVLYELVSGRQPFGGATATDTILAIVDKEPQSLSRYVPEAPEALEWIITKAFTKEREERYQTAREMVNDLKRLKQRIDAQTELERTGAPDESPASQTVTQMRQHSTAPPPVTKTVSSAEFIAESVKSHKAISIALLGLVAVFLIGGGWVIYRFTRPSETSSGAMKITRLTNDGQSGAVSISADGKYVVYTSGPEEQRSLWVRQTTTGSAVQIVPPAPGQSLGTTFSPDGDHIYYTWASTQNQKGSLYEIPVLGGTPRQILSDISGPVSFSPDGRRMVFVRGEATLVAANTDGTNEQILYSARPETEWFAQEGGAWSPDGRVIVIGKGSSVGGLAMNLFEIDAGGGALRPLTQSNWKGEISRSVWLKDGSGLVVTASENFVSGAHVWFVAYPSGTVRRITNDLNGYGTFSLGITDDGKTIATVLEETRRHIWLAAPNDDEAKARRLTTDKMDAQATVLADGRIVFVRTVGDQQDLWIMNGDGGAQRQLTKDQSFDYEPVVTPDGRYIVWTSDRSGLPHIWRMNVDGTDARQLTTGDTFDDGNPSVTPDGKWVIYNSWQTGKWSPWKVSIDGGEPQLLLDGYAGIASVAPDGQNYLAAYVDEQKQPAPLRAAVLPISGGGPVKMFDVYIPRSYAPAGTAWSPDGKTIFYVQDRNVMSMNIADGKTKPVTNFKTETIFSLSTSADGKRFLLSRGEVINDVVLIKDFR